MMTLRTKQKILVGLLAFFVSGAAIAVCQSNNTMTLTQVLKTIGNLAQQVRSLLSSFSDSNSESERNIRAAIKTQTKQIATLAEKEIVNTSQAMQSLSTTLIAQDAALNVQKTYENFSSTTGQGFDPCGEYTRSMQIANSYHKAVNVSVELDKTLDRAPGTYKDPLKTQNERMTAHSQFCTTDEQTAGLCKKSSSAAAEDEGASLTFATMFKKARKGDNVDKAKNAFVNNIFGLPTAPVDARVASTPEGMAAMRDKMMRDGYLSIAATSFKAIQAMYQVGDGKTEAEGGDTLSFMEGLNNTTGQYTGGNRYKDWATSLTVQSERGLMVNLVKMSATKLYLASVEYDQYERMEANLAALLALENRKRAGY